MQVSVSKRVVGGKRSLDCRLVDFSRPEDATVYLRTNHLIG
jgi:hypothetical protein